MEAIATPTIAPERAPGGRPPIPFDAARLDALMEEAGIDALVVTSKHNIQYLLGGYKFFFFEAMDAIGVNRYLPAVVYQKGKPERSAYVGNNMETYEQELGAFWPIYYMLVYSIVGLWVGWAFVAIGLVITALTLIGYFFVGSSFDLWMAVVNGGGLIVGGLWMRRT